MYVCMSIRETIESSTYWHNEFLYPRLKSKPNEFTLNQLVAAHHRVGGFLQGSQSILK